MSRMAAFIFGPNGKEGLKALLSGRQKQYAKNRKERGLLNSEKQEEKKQKAKTNDNVPTVTPSGFSIIDTRTAKIVFALPSGVTISPGDFLYTNLTLDAEIYG